MPNPSFTLRKRAHPALRRAWARIALAALGMMLAPLHAVRAADTDVKPGDPAAQDRPPDPVLGVEAHLSGDFVIALSWASVDPRAEGVAVERCWSRAGRLSCDLAAALHADARGFEYHAIQPWQFRVAAFNRNGVSAYSALSKVIGESHTIAHEDAPALPPERSLLARRIVAVDAWRCTTPQQMVAEGLELVAVREDLDLYRASRDECGTGGCPYASFTVTAGCYHLHEGGLGLYHQAPFLGGPEDADDRLRLASSSGRACEGSTTVFRRDEQVDGYDWYACYDEHLPGLRVPFNPRGLQRPDVPR